jgi:hypothetical protein
MQAAEEKTPHQTIGVEQLELDDARELRHQIQQQTLGLGKEAAVRKHLD